MMFKNKKLLLILGICILIAASGGFLWFQKGQESNKKLVEELINPKIENIKITVSTIGEIKPQNRIEIMPSISGRVESILVQEGAKVRAGQVIAYMSSTERAALLDAARTTNPGELKKWKQIYKPVQILAPISGEIIVRAIEPGQSVNTTSVIMVISDRLIVRAEVDETDIGKVNKGQKVEITLDAYPEEVILGTVSHISYESKLVNNVTIYEVEIIPQKIPYYFRSGMSATLEIIIAQSKNALTIPLEVIIEKNNRQFVLIKGSDGQVQKQEIKLGLKNGTKAEVVSGLAPAMTIISKKTEYNFESNKEKGSPLIPRRRKKK
ncbi:efflux RND transporter periplasmic adaptor subunit [Candidatus Margulisiibacteriota bacterium]